MREWKELRSVLIWFGLGLLNLWFAWTLWREFAEFESGQRATLKVWAPIALLYNLGGAWTVVAKWGFICMLSLAGSALAWMYGSRLFFPRKVQVAPPAAPLPPAPAKVPYDRALYDLSMELEVTRAQVAAEEEIALAGPNGPVAVKLQRKFRNGRLRFPNEGRERKGDLFVNLKIRDA